MASPDRGRRRRSVSAIILQPCWPEPAPTVLRATVESGAFGARRALFQPDTMERNMGHPSNGKTPGNGGTIGAVRLAPDTAACLSREPKLSIPDFPPTSAQTEWRAL